MKVYVGGLSGPLEKITQDDLQKLFGSMGEIEFIDLHKDPYTEKSKGNYIKDPYTRSSHYDFTLSIFPATGYCLMKFIAKDS
jgi:RNA recognition motif-containing protein